VLHDLQRLGSLTAIWRHLSDTWDRSCRAEEKSDDVVGKFEFYFRSLYPAVGPEARFHEPEI
jgi:hypothetical protein